METALFWTLWGIISFLALKTFYFSYDKEKIRKLRQAAFGINLAVLILFFLPWLPLPRGVLSGWEIVWQGDPMIILLPVLIAVSTFSFLTKNHSLLKTGAVLNIAASVLFIAAMMRLMPGTFKLTVYSVAPIIASMLLLVNNVVVLLLWHQLQLKTKK